MWATPIPDAPKHEFQTTQANLPTALATKLKRYQRSLAKDDVLELEDQPHITVKYGLHADVTLQDVKRVLAGQGPVYVSFGPNGVFPAGDDGAPLYVSVVSPDLQRLHALLSDALPNTETHAGYTPHATIAYLKPAAAAKYAGQQSPLSGTSATIDSIAFSDQNGDQTEIKLTGLSDGADAERLVLEARHARKLTRILRAQLRTILPRTTTPDNTHGVVARLHAAEKPLRDALYAMLLEGALLGADHGRQQVERLQGTSKP